MRDPARIDVMLAKLGELWKQSPDLRLGQLVENVASEVRIATNRYQALVFYIEDEDMLRAVTRRLEEE